MSPCVCACCVPPTHMRAACCSPCLYNSPSYPLCLKSGICAYAWLLAAQFGRVPSAPEHFACLLVSAVPLALVLVWQSSPSSLLTPCLCFLSLTHLHRCGTRNIRRGRYDPAYQSWHQDNNLMLFFIMTGRCHPFYKVLLFSHSPLPMPPFCLDFFFYLHKGLQYSSVISFLFVLHSSIFWLFSITSEHSLLCVNGNFITGSIKRVFVFLLSFFAFIYVPSATNSLILKQVGFFARRNSKVYMLNMPAQYSEHFGLLLKSEVMYPEIHDIPSACNRFFNVCCMSCRSSSSMWFLFLRSSGVWMLSLCCPAASCQLWRKTKRWCLPLSALGSLLFPSPISSKPGNFNDVFLLEALFPTRTEAPWNARYYILLRQCYFSVLLFFTAAILTVIRL